MSDAAWNIMGVVLAGVGFIGTGISMEEGKPWEAVRSFAIAVLITVWLVFKFGVVQ